MVPWVGLWPLVVASPGHSCFFLVLFAIAAVMVQIMCRENDLKNVLPKLSKSWIVLIILNQQNCCRYCFNSAILGEYLVQAIESGWCTFHTLSYSYSVNQVPMLLNFFMFNTSEHATLTGDKN